MILGLRLYPAMIIIGSLKHCFKYFGQDRLSNLLGNLTLRNAMLSCCLLFLRLAKFPIYQVCGGDIGGDIPGISHDQIGICKFIGVTLMKFFRVIQRWNIPISTHFSIDGTVAYRGS